MAAEIRQAGRPPGDRRSQRTRKAIFEAFRAMILAGGYDEITPTTLAAAANVGRSTFYEHFSNVDEVLAFSIADLLAPLAASATRPQMVPTAATVVQHFWDNRKMARTMLSGGGHKIISKIFADQLEDGLVSLRTELKVGEPLIPPPAAASYLAAASLALLAEWLSGRASGSATDIALALHDAGYAAAVAFSKRAAVKP